MKHTAHGYWLEEAGPVSPVRGLEEDISADVVIVGGGYTGMWAAWFIRELEPDAKVVVLEGRTCGHGPSGRNAGFANAMWFSLPAMRRRFGDAAALAVARASQREVDELGGWCEEHDVDAWYRQAGYLQVSTASAHDRVSADIAAACRALGEPDACGPLDPAEVAAICRSPIFRGGAFYPGAATVQPARLVRGLRARLLEHGVEVFERSLVRRVESGGTDAVISTDRGMVRARAAVLAAGGALVGLPPLRRRLTVTSSHMLITEPVPEVLDELGWTGGECITDSRAMIHYMRTTPDGRIAFGWGGGRVVKGTRLDGRAELDREVLTRVAAHLRRFFPQLSGRSISHGWGGPIDVSPSHLPVIASLPEGNTHFAFGYTGNGVSPSRLAGRALASLALDRRDDVTRLAIVEPPTTAVPPEPLRYIGGTLIREALLRREAAEEAARRPKALARLVSGIPQRIGIHIGR